MQPGKALRVTDGTGFCQSTGLQNLEALIEIPDGQKQLVAKHVQVLVLSFRKGGGLVFPDRRKMLQCRFFRM